MPRKPPAKKLKNNRGRDLLTAWLADSCMGSRTATNLAKQLHVAVSYVSMLISGDATPGLRLAVRIEEVTKIAPRAWLEKA